MTTAARDTGWVIDAVAAAALSTEDLATVVWSLDQSREGLRGGLSMPIRTPFPVATPRLHYDRRDGRRRVRMTNLHLTENAIYSAEDDRNYSHTGMGSDDTGSSVVHFATKVSIVGATPPDAVLASLAGRSATTLLDHPALRHPDLIIDAVHVDTRDGKPTGFSVAFPVVTVPLIE